jgi:hypothetical protein
MLKWLLCVLLGHKTVAKAYTGETYQNHSYGGNPLSVSMYVWKRHEFCLRCGNDVPHAKEEERHADGSVKGGRGAAGSDDARA